MSSTTLTVDGITVDPAPFIADGHPEKRAVAMAARAAGMSIRAIAEDLWPVAFGATTSTGSVSAMLKAGRGDTPTTSRQPRVKPASGPATPGTVDTTASAIDRDRAAIQAATERLTALVNDGVGAMVRADAATAHAAAIARAEEQHARAIAAADAARDAAIAAASADVPTPALVDQLGEVVRAADTLVNDYRNAREAMLVAMGVSGAPDEPVVMEADHVIGLAHEKVVAMRSAIPADPADAPVVDVDDSTEDAPAEDAPAEDAPAPRRKARAAK